MLADLDIDDLYDDSAGGLSARIRVRFLAGANGTWMARPIPSMRTIGRTVEGSRSGVRRVLVRYRRTAEVGEVPVLCSCTPPDYKSPNDHVWGSTGGHKIFVWKGCLATDVRVEAGLCAPTCDTL